MKTLLQKIIFCALATVVIGYGMYAMQETLSPMDLTLENVEALANSETSSGEWIIYYRPEGDGYNCTKGGSEYC